VEESADANVENPPEEVKQPVEGEVEKKVNLPYFLQLF